MPYLFDSTSKLITDLVSMNNVATNFDSPEVGLKVADFHFILALCAKLRHQQMTSVHLSTAIYTATIKERFVRQKSIGFTVT